jgi:hypothetical protein
MGNVTRFLPKAERIAKGQAEEARQMILALGLPETATEDILITLARHETGGKLAEWKFNMLNPAQCLAVWDAIRELPADDRPNQVRHLFDLILTHIETNTGAVTLTREELAEKVGTTPNHISRMMGTLERLGVIYRRRVKVAGMRGAGVARYYVNPHVAWNGSLEVRKEQSKEQPLPFGVIEGGKSNA